MLPWLLPRLNYLGYHYLILFTEWRMERQQLPDSIHFSVLLQHIGQEDKLLGDLADAAKAVWVSKICEHYDCISENNINFYISWV